VVDAGACETWLTYGNIVRVPAGLMWLCWCRLLRSNDESYPQSSAKSSFRAMPRCPSMVPPRRAWIKRIVRLISRPAKVREVFPGRLWSRSRHCERMRVLGSSSNRRTNSDLPLVGRNLLDVRATSHWPFPPQSNNCSPVRRRPSIFPQAHLWFAPKRGKLRTISSRLSRRSKWLMWGSGPMTSTAAPVGIFVHSDTIMYGQRCPS
jgi:hypothetical protein